MFLLGVVLNVEFRGDVDVGVMFSPAILDIIVMVKPKDSGRREACICPWAWWISIVASISTFSYAQTCGGSAISGLNYGGSQQHHSGSQRLDQLLLLKPGEENFDYLPP